MRNHVRGLCRVASSDEYRTLRKAERQSVARAKTHANRSRGPRAGQLQLYRGVFARAVHRRVPVSRRTVTRATNRDRVMC